MKKMIYLFIALIILIMCWENSLAATQLIPDESIRIRIIANSDSPQDQWIKQKVRDAVIDEMKHWSGNLTSGNLESVRILLKSHLPEIDRRIEKTLSDYGFKYDYQVELGIFPFPIKSYANHLYPAGQYEALRVVLGEGKGKNWWCVVFPPLCLTDFVTAKEKNSQKVVDNRTRVKTEKLGSKPEIKPASFFAELWNSWF